MSLPLALVQNPQSHHLQILLSILTTSPTRWQRSPPYQDHEEQVEEEGKRQSQVKRSRPKNQVKKIEEMDLKT
jgi:hypothetical protein